LKRVGRGAASFYIITIRPQVWEDFSRLMPSALRVSNLYEMAAALCSMHFGSAVRLAFCSGLPQTSAVGLARPSLGGYE